MKKILCGILACAMVLGMTASAAFAKSVKPNKYSLPLEGTILQNIEDRNIKPKTALTLNPMIPGESPTTGLPWDDTEYQPMIIQISNPEGSVKYNGKTVKGAGLGQRSPWGGQYADIVYEGILYRTGATRISYLFNDSFADGLPVSVGPVRSARIGHVLLREEWYAGIAYAGGPRTEDNDIRELFRETGADEAGVIFDLLSGDFTEFKNRVSGVKAPDNYNCNPLGLRSLIPDEYEAVAHPFLFTDASPYTDGYDLAYTINLDWGDKSYISHYYYDEMENLYLRYSCDAPYMTYVDSEDRNEENQIQMSFSNVIIQRVHYDYANNNKIMPIMQNVGKGNADIFIGGRYIPGYWVRESIKSPTIYFDDQGNELQFTRGKTYIAHFPSESLCTFTGIE